MDGVLLSNVVIGIAFALVTIATFVVILSMLRLIPSGRAGRSLVPPGWVWVGSASTTPPKPGRVPVAHAIERRGAEFAVASTPRQFDRQSGEWRDGEAMSMRCNIWRRPAENIAETLSRDSRVIVPALSSGAPTRPARKREWLHAAWPLNTAGVALHPDTQLEGKQITMRFAGRGINVDTAPIRWHRSSGRGVRRLLDSDHRLVRCGPRRPASTLRRILVPALGER